MTTARNSLASVVICNYNYGRYLQECLDSVFSQTHEKLEIIVVDDGSTDHSRQILESVNHPSFQFICQQNSGQAAAMNAGFEQCKGEFVAFLDSDDFWERSKLDNCIAAFDSDDISAVQHRLKIVDSGSEATGKLHPRLTPGRKTIEASYFKENHTNFFSATSGIVCRRAVLEKIFPLDPAWKICADVALTRPLPIFGEIVTLDQILGNYRIHGKNFWMNSEAQDESLTLQQKYVDYTNRWLAEFGIGKQIIFEKSYPYLVARKKSKLPMTPKMYASYWYNRIKGGLLRWLRGL